MGGALCVSILIALAQAGVPSNTTLSSTAMSIAFSPQTGGVTAINSTDSQTKFIQTPSEKPMLWELVFRDSKGKEVVLSNVQAPAPRIEPGKGSLIEHWDHLALEKEAAMVDVRVQCDLPADASMATLKLWVDNASPDLGLWDVRFPIVSSLGTAGAVDVAMGRGSWGMLYRNLADEVHGEYPSAQLPMQFMLMQQAEHGLYLAAYDPGAMYKTFSMNPGKEFRVASRAIDMGVAGSDWAAPYPFEIGVYKGSWMDGCKIYRNWATKSAPWTKKGLLADRKDVPDTMKRVCAWVRADGAPEVVEPKVKQFADAVGAPVGVHWYNWHHIPFDTYYPNYFPPKPGFAEAVKRLTAQGITVMPYINSRLWNTANQNFADARVAATKTEDGKITIETYGSGAQLAVMCPTQKLWQDKVSEIVQELGTECGVNAVYLDQIASAPPRTCFDATHGHPLGSGRWWADGYRTLLTPIKQWCTSDGRQIGLTSENDAEPYMDNIDDHLIWTPRSDQEIPMTTAVYSGYTIYFASNRCFDFGDASYCLCQARDFVWGSQLGWDDTSILQPEHAEKLKFLARLAQVRAKAADYLVYGELVDVVKPVNEAPMLSGKWNTPKGDAAVTLPAVHAAIWRGRDGTACVLVANADAVPHTYTFHFDSTVLMVSAPATWSVTPLGQASSLHNGTAFDVSYDVPARDATLIVIRRSP